MKQNQKIKATFFPAYFEPIVNKTLLNQQKIKIITIINSFFQMKVKLFNQVVVVVVVVQTVKQQRLKLTMKTMQIE